MLNIVDAFMYMLICYMLILFALVMKPVDYFIELYTVVCISAEPNFHSYTSWTKLYIHL